MFKEVLLGLLFFNTLSSECQVISIRQPSKLSVFAGGLNEIQFAVRGYSCNKLILSTSNGALKKTNNCWYSYVPVDTGTTTIEVKIWERNKLKKIDELTLHVKDPNVSFLMGPSKGGDIQKQLFEVQEYVRVESYDFNCSYYYPFSIDSFLIQVRRDTIVIFEKWNIGNKLSNEAKSEFYMLKENDLVIISNITGQTPFRRRKIESQTTYKITE